MKGNIPVQDTVSEQSRSQDDEVALYGYPHVASMVIRIRVPAVILTGSGYGTLLHSEVT